MMTALLRLQDQPWTPSTFSFPVDPRVRAHERAAVPRRTCSFPSHQARRKLESLPSRRALLVPTRRVRMRMTEEWTGRMPHPFLHRLMSKRRMEEGTARRRIPRRRLLQVESWNLRPNRGRQRLHLPIRTSPARVSHLPRMNSLRTIGSTRAPMSMFHVKHRRIFCPSRVRPSLTFRSTTSSRMRGSRARSSMRMILQSCVIRSAK